MGITTLTLFTVLPLYFAYILRKWEKKLALPETRKKIDKLYPGLKTVDDASKKGNRPLTWLYSPLFLIRRGLFAATTVYLLKYPSLQFTIHLSLSLVFVTAFLAQG